MVIPSNRLPFHLAFFQSNKEFLVGEFQTDSSTPLEPIVQIKENITLEVLFESDDEDARFYMDGLEMLPEKVIELDEYRMAFLPPSENRVVLFKSFNNDYYPLIPGYYRLTVSVKGKEYYALIQVVPKQVTVEQWEVMRDELESELRGLAQDLIRKNLGMGRSDIKGLPVEMVHRFLVIVKHYPSVMAALNDLFAKVNSRIRKDYRLVPTERAKAIDQVTIRHRLTHPENTTSLKTPVREIDYDLPENQWVCWFVRVVSNDLEDVIQALNAYGTLIEEELVNYKYDNSAYVREHRKILETLHAYSEKANKMKLGLQLIKLAPWYQEVSQTRFQSIPPVLKYDPRYRALYRLYRDLRSTEFEIELDSSYAYQWKRTDRLYEMWGFLKICKTLTNALGFEAKSGWLYSSHFDGKHLLIPTLPADTRILLEKGNLQLHLRYNSTLPPKSNEKAEDVICLNVSYHDMPDSCIDVYQEGTYIGSIVIDFKYRPLHGFWDPSKIPTRRPSATNQLISYRSDSTSSHLFGDQISDSMRRQLRPVLEVWALYPTGNEAYAPKYDEQHSVRLMKVCPGDPLDHLAEELQNGIVRVQKFYHEYTGRLDSVFSEEGV